MKYGEIELSTKENQKIQELQIDMGGIHAIRKEIRWF